MVAPRFVARDIGLDGIGPLSFALDRGECLGLFGPSGAGKTRLLRALADLESHRGQAWLDGRSAADIDAPAWRRAVMFLAAEPGWWAASVAEHLPPDAPARPPLLEALGLDQSLLAAAPGRLSSGQRQRLALLRVLIRGPRVLLLDEPTASLDAANVAGVERLVADYCRKNAACCVWVGHDRAQRARVANRQVALDARGKIRA